MTAGLIPADEGSDRLTVDREALIARWYENFGLDGPWDMRIAQQEAEHVAGLVEAAVESTLAAQREQYEAKLWRARNMVNGRCRYCGVAVDQGRPHRMSCRHYVGPLEHRWVRKDINGAFGGIDYDCVCGGWFRQGGLAGHGDGSDTAEPVCPNADQAWRGRP